MTKKKKAPKSAEAKMSKALEKRRHPDSVMLAEEVESRVESKLAKLENLVTKLVQREERRGSGSLTLGASAQTLLADARTALRQGLASVQARGQTSIRFTLDNGDELAGAQQLELAGMGRLTFEGAKNAPEPKCKIHGDAYPCRLGQKRLASGAGMGGTDGSEMVCDFPMDVGADGEWVFEFTRVDGTAEMGGVLRGSSVDVDL